MASSLAKIRFSGRSLILRQASTASSQVKILDNVVKKPSQPLSDAGVDKVKKISASMKAFLQASREQSDLLNARRGDFELGKRHLANIMGFDHNSMTQKDIDEAIKYLFPTNLFSPKHRPVMLPPEQIYPRLKEADFDVQGRPFHCFAYTRLPMFYQTMHDINDVFSKCNQLEDKMISKGVLIPPPEARIELEGSRWISLRELTDKLAEPVTQELFTSFIYGLTKLAAHPYSDSCKDFILDYRVQLQPEISGLSLSSITMDEDGRSYVKIEASRKTSKSQVTVYQNGTGKFLVNGHSILYFPHIKDRKQILSPLIVSKLLGKVDIEVEASGNGLAGQAGAIRYGLSLCLASLVDESTREEMRVAGLLVKDKRHRERCKPGKKGPRRSSAWRPR